MKCAVFLLMVTGALAAPRQGRSFGPLRDFQPLEAIRGFIFSSEEEDGAASTHELIPLSEFPAWKLHHYSGVDLKPVSHQEIADTPLSTADYLAASHVTHGDEGEDALAALGGLSTGLSALAGIREAISSLRATITSLPHTLLGAIGLGEEEPEEDVSEGLPALPSLQDVVQLPESVLSLLPTLPHLPINLPVHTKSKKPEVYVTVNKQPELPTKYEAPKTHYGAPPVKTSHRAPEGMVLPLNLPQGDVEDYAKLAVAGANALSQFNTVNEAVDAINSLNEINSLASIGERVDEGFKPSTGVVMSALDVQPNHAATVVDAQPSSHSAVSQPTRDTPPQGFRGSQGSVVIVTPAPFKP